LTEEQKTLKKFAWYEDLRPVDRYDIFRFYKRKPKETKLVEPNKPEAELEPELEPASVELETLPVKADAPSVETETETEAETEVEEESEPVESGLNGKENE
jgi:hypothetical protein